MTLQQTVFVRRSFIRSLDFWSPAIGMAAMLIAVGAFCPRTAAQTVGPITPNGSARAAQQTPQSAPPPAPAPVAKTSLAGSWRMNKDESDDPREKQREATGNSGGNGGGTGGRRGGGWGMGGPGMGGPGQGPWGGGGGQGGGGWGGNRGGNNGDENDDARNGGAMDMTDLSALTIEQSDTSAKVTGATGRILCAYSSSNPDATNKAPNNKSSNDGSYTPPAAQLQNGQLVVVMPGRQRGAKTTRTYALSDDHTRLWVTTKIENPRLSQPVTIRLVYDQSKPASGA